ncbi:MAG: hypothetical protein KDN05_19375 [Verrucomicrobiae bacterium]|nr:hypothetical protein [Verrucomicrobiae bacterium]
MTEPSEIAEVFGIFHDGTIVGGAESVAATELIVEVEYLAERVRQDYRRFTIRFEDVGAMRFVPWIDEGADSIADITDFSVIVGSEFDILSAEAVDSTLRVACAQDRSGFGYSGGFLEFSACSCQVLDEAGSVWTLEELRKLSDDYWSDWAARNKQAQSGPRE